MDTTMAARPSLASDAVGALLAGEATWLRLPWRPYPDVDAHRLISAEETPLAARFAVHALLVHEHLSDYVDALADGNPELRERPRRHKELQCPR